MARFISPSSKIGRAFSFSVFQSLGPDPDPEPGLVSWTWVNPQALVSGSSLVFLSGSEVLAGNVLVAGWEYSIDGGPFAVWEPDYQQYNYYGGASSNSLLINSEWTSGAIVLALNPGQTVQWKTSDGLLTPIVTVQAPPPPPPSSLTVFDESTGPNSSVTGGWYSYITGGYGSPVVSTDNNQLTVSAPWWQDAQVEPNNDISLAGAISITLVVSSFSNHPWYYYSNFSYPQSDGQYAGVAIANPGDYNFTNRTVTIPLTNPANGKLRLGVTNSGSSAGDGWTRIHSIVVNY